MIREMKAITADAMSEDVVKPFMRSGSVRAKQKPAVLSEQRAIASNLVANQGLEPRTRGL